MKYIVDRLKEKSTYEGTLSLLGGFHFWFTDLTLDEFIALFMIGIGLIGIFMPERLD